MNSDRNQPGRSPSQADREAASATGRSELRGSVGSKSGGKLKGVSLGIELAATLIGFSLVGIWIDRSFETAPWGILICVGMGLVGGFYNFLRSSMKVLGTSDIRGRRQEKDD